MLDEPVRNDNSFLLPDALGWACNDELSNYIDNWFNQLLKMGHKAKVETAPEAYALAQVAKAELIDNMYAIIKKYQRDANSSTNRG